MGSDMSRGISKWFNAGLLALLVAAVLATHPALGKIRPTDLSFSLHKLESGEPGPTVLVIGGIQGDEPGGFNAAALLTTHYRITQGNVWVVPNLNFHSIVKRTRGVHGDMNRKFMQLKETDPEYSAVQKIQSIILDNEVDLVLNLHDGSGFYHPKHIDKSRNPHRWGQSIIIDQESIEAFYGDMGDMAREVIDQVNQGISTTKHRYHLKNTHTANGDREMEKTLTYFAIRNGKPAVGVEASKTFRTYQRAHYHLRVIEAYLDRLGIGFERPFDLTPADVKAQIDNDVRLALYDNEILLDISRPRPWLRYVPLKKNEPLEFNATNPLVTVLGGDKHYSVYYGNRRVTNLHPQYFSFDNSLRKLAMEIDGNETEVSLGSVIDVAQSFKVQPLEGYRVNAIGFSRQGVKNESGITLRKTDFMQRFSVDKRAAQYRIEVYQEKKFCGMVVVNFIADPDATTNKVSLSAPKASATPG